MGKLRPRAHGILLKSHHQSGSQGVAEHGFRPRGPRHSPKPWPAAPPPGQLVLPVPGAKRGSLASTICPSFPPLSSWFFLLSLPPPPPSLSSFSPGSGLPHSSAGTGPVGLCMWPELPEAGSCGLSPQLLRLTSLGLGFSPKVLKQHPPDQDDECPGGAVIWRALQTKLRVCPTCHR